MGSVSGGSIHAPHPTGSDSEFVAARQRPRRTTGLMRHPVTANAVRVTVRAPGATLSERRRFTVARTHEGMRSMALDFRRGEALVVDRFGTVVDWRTSGAAEGATRRGGAGPAAARVRVGAG